MTNGLRIHLYALFALLLIAAIAYIETLRSMVEVYIRSDTFVHGFIILPISVYLVWRRWPVLKSIAPQMFFPGIILIFAISGSWFLADILDIQVGKHFAVTAIIPAVVVTTMGVSFTRSTAFPLAYLLFAVPFGEFWVPDLQEITADLAVAFLRFTGIPVLRDDLFITTPTGLFEVAEACSGIRYILATLSLGTLYAYLSFRKFHKRLIFIVFSLALPIVANGIRAYGIIAIAHFSDMKYAVGIDHLIYGWLFFGLVIALMFLVGNRFRDSDLRDFDDLPQKGRDTERPPMRRRIVFIVPVAMVAIIAGPLASYALEFENGQKNDHVNGLPNVVAGWQGYVLSEPLWQPSFIGATRESLARYRSSDAQVDVAVIRYSSWQQGGDLTNILNSVPGDNSRQQRSIRSTSVQFADGSSIQLLETSAEIHGRIRVFWYWYNVDGSVVLSRPRIKLLEARRLLSGQSGDSSVIIVSAVDDGDIRSTLHSFLADAFDAINSCLIAVVPKDGCALDLPPVDSRTPLEEPVQ